MDRSVYPDFTGRTFGNEQTEESLWADSPFPFMGQSCAVTTEPPTSSVLRSTRDAVRARRSRSVRIFERFHAYDGNVKADVIEAGQVF